jgi:hypothetical protein
MKEDGHENKEYEKWKKTKFIYFMFSFVYSVVYSLILEIKPQGSKDMELDNGEQDSGY